MTEQAVEGMTVNERLFHFGLTDRFEAAARTGDVFTVVEILRQAKLSESQAAQTAQAIAEHSKHYGY